MNRNPLTPAPPHAPAPHASRLTPFCWKDRPALIESLFPVQKLSVESYKEQMAGNGKTLTALGSYWKGRKPLILNKACVLGCLLPASDNPLKDLQIFELLMGMDDRSLAVRLGHIKPADIVQRVSGLETAQWFETDVAVELPLQTPFKLADYPVEVLRSGSLKKVIPKLKWKADVSEQDQLRLEAMALPPLGYRETVSLAKRPEEIAGEVHKHIWDEVNTHLGTAASCMTELVEQMGMARFGRRPKVADVFSGSGQIPFEAARLGCDVYASDLNPIACMLTWGAFHIVGASPEKRVELEKAQRELANKVQAQIDALGVESDGNGWRAKAFLYCVEAKCPESGWMVPLIPSLIISKGYRVIAQLIPDPVRKRYEIEIRYVDNDVEVTVAELGTVQDGDLVHSPDGINTYRTSIATLRGDYREKGINKNRLRLWEKHDFIPSPDDIFQERLYCVQWMRQKENSTRDEYQFRAVTPEDLAREQTVIDFVGSHLAEWQQKGFVPDMVIEPGYNTDQPIRERGWTHWHHLFNPRQLLVASMFNRYSCSDLKFGFTRILNQSCKISRWDNAKGSDKIQGAFDNQALNTVFNYGARSCSFAKNLMQANFKHDIISSVTKTSSHPAQEIPIQNDLYITDPPYGDAVKYEEITEFFIAWLRKNTPPEFAHWTWDSRRALAVKGEDEGFRQGMIAAYKRTAEMMPDNGMQVLMFTHQSGSIWADMTHIVWAAGLQVTAAWYVVTETDSALRQGANVKGTILLVLRKRIQRLETFRDDLGWEIESAVKEQVDQLIQLDQSVRARQSEGLYTDADLQMAGYAAALKVLTTYAVIDGKEMETEARAPRQKGVKSFVDQMIEFAVQTAVQFLVPVGFEKAEWQRLKPVERYYLKMVEMEAQGDHTLDNFQNFAKAFKVHHFDDLMAVARANAARLMLSSEFKSSLMTAGSELGNTPLRALLYAMWEVQRDIDMGDILLHLMENARDLQGGYSANKPLMIKTAAFIAEKREGLKKTKIYRPDEEASAARILKEALENQRI